jgi:hypothetical protein
MEYSYKDHMSWLEYERKLFTENNGKHMETEVNIYLANYAWSA